MSEYLVDLLPHIEELPAAPRAEARARLLPLDGLRGLIHHRDGARPRQRLYRPRAPAARAMERSHHAPRRCAGLPDALRHPLRRARLFLPDGRGHGAVRRVAPAAGLDRRRYLASFRAARTRADRPAIAGRESGLADRRGADLHAAGVPILFRRALRPGRGDDRRFVPAAAAPGSADRPGAGGDAGDRTGDHERGPRGDRSFSAGATADHTGAIERFHRLLSADPLAGRGAVRYGLRDLARARPGAGLPRRGTDRPGAAGAVRRAAAGRRLRQPPAAKAGLDRLPERGQVPAQQRLPGLDTQRRPATIGASGTGRPPTVRAFN
jgi:hypothetical protein